jgi:hypothetical protein
MAAAAAAILPSLNLHWLPSIIANPNIAVNPSQLSTLAAKLSPGTPVGTPSATPNAPPSTAVPISAPIGSAIPTSPGILLPSGKIVTASGGIYGQTPGVQMTNVYTGPGLGSVYGASSFPQAASTLQLTPQESAHYESDVPGGSEKESPPNGNNRRMEMAKLESAEAATLLPAIRIPTAAPTMQVQKLSQINFPVTTGAGTVIAAEEVTKSTEELEDERIYKEVQSVISPKGIIFNITIHTVILSAFIFIAILAWVEVIRTWYDQTFDPTFGIRNIDLIFTRFWYAVFITCLVIIFVYILHRWSKSS